MYQPPAFVESRDDALRALIEAAHVGDLITVVDGVLSGIRVPLLFDADGSEHGRLLGHLARANPQARNSDPGFEALVIFNGPDGYISPSMYPTKEIAGEVVPTWNYTTVHASGPLVVHDDPTWTLDLVTRLTNHHEGIVTAPGAEAWEVSDAPDAFIEQNLRAIVGIEIPLTSLIGKSKLSQNRPEEDQAGVRRGLAERGENDLLAVMPTEQGKRQQ